MNDGSIAFVAFYIFFSSINSITALILAVDVTIGRDVDPVLPILVFVFTGLSFTMLLFVGIHVFIVINSTIEQRFELVDSINDGMS